MAMPLSLYELCAERSSPPGKQTGSPVAHSCRVLGAYAPPMLMGGASLATRFMNHGSGVPNSTTEATCGATAGASGPRPAGTSTPAGTLSAVVYPATAAPWE